MRRVTRRSYLHVTARRDIVNLPGNQFGNLAEMFRIESIFKVQVVFNSVTARVLIDSRACQLWRVTDTGLSFPFQRYGRAKCR
jgi:hypothetical protein